MFDRFPIAYTEKVEEKRGAEMLAFRRAVSADVGNIQELLHLAESANLAYKSSFIKNLGKLTSLPVSEQKIDLSIEIKDDDIDAIRGDLYILIDYLIDRIGSVLPMELSVQGKKSLVSWLKMESDFATDFNERRKEFLAFAEKVRAQKKAASALPLDSTELVVWLEMPIRMSNAIYGARLQSEMKQLLDSHEAVFRVISMPSANSDIDSLLVTAGQKLKGIAEILAPYVGRKGDCWKTHAEIAGCIAPIWAKGSGTIVVPNPEQLNKIKLGILRLQCLHEVLSSMPSLQQAKNSIKDNAVLSRKLTEVISQLQYIVKNLCANVQDFPEEKWSKGLANIKAIEARIKCIQSIQLRYSSALAAVRQVQTDFAHTFKPREKTLPKWYGSVYALFGKLPSQVEAYLSDRIDKLFVLALDFNPNCILEVDLPKWEISYDTLNQEIVAIKQMVKTQFACIAETHVQEADFCSCMKSVDKLVHFAATEKSYTQVDLAKNLLGWLDLFFEEKTRQFLVLPAALSEAKSLLFSSSPLAQELEQFLVEKKAIFERSIAELPREIGKAFVNICAIQELLTAIDLQIKNFRPSKEKHADAWQAQAMQKLQAVYAEILKAAVKEVSALPMQSKDFSDTQLAQHNASLQILNGVLNVVKNGMQYVLTNIRIVAESIKALSWDIGERATISHSAFLLKILIGNLQRNLDDQIKNLLQLLTISDAGINEKSFLEKIRNKFLLWNEELPKLADKIRLLGVRVTEINSQVVEIYKLFAGLNALFEKLPSSKEQDFNALFGMLLPRKKQDVSFDDVNDAIRKLIGGLVEKLKGEIEGLAICFAAELGSEIHDSKYSAGLVAVREHIAIVSEFLKYWVENITTLNAQLQLLAEENFDLCDPLGVKDLLEAKAKLCALFTRGSNDVWVSISTRFAEIKSFVPEVLLLITDANERLVECERELKVVDHNERKDDEVVSLIDTGNARGLSIQGGFADRKTRLREECLKLQCELQADLRSDCSLLTADRSRADRIVAIQIDREFVIEARGNVPLDAVAQLSSGERSQLVYLINCRRYLREGLELVRSPLRKEIQEEVTKAQTVIKGHRVEILECYDQIAGCDREIMEQKRESKPFTDFKKGELVSTLEQRMKKIEEDLRNSALALQNFDGKSVADLLTVRDAWRMVARQYTDDLRRSLEKISTGVCQFRRLMPILIAAEKSINAAQLLLTSLEPQILANSPYQGLQINEHKIDDSLIVSLKSRLRSAQSDLNQLQESILKNGADSAFSALEEKLQTLASSISEIVKDIEAVQSEAALYDKVSKFICDGTKAKVDALTQAFEDVGNLNLNGMREKFLDFMKDDRQTKILRFVATLSLDTWETPSTEYCQEFLAKCESFTALINNMKTLDMKLRALGDSIQELQLPSGFQQPLRDEQLRILQLLADRHHFFQTNDMHECQTRVSWLEQRYNALDYSIKMVRSEGGIDLPVSDEQLLVRQRSQGQFNANVAEVIARLTDECLRLQREKARNAFRIKVIEDLITGFREAKVKFYFAEPSRPGSEHDDAIGVYQTAIKEVITKQLTSKNMNEISRDHRNVLIRLLVSIYIKLFGSRDDAEQINPRGFWATKTAKVLVDAKRQLNDLISAEVPYAPPGIISQA